jgi:hypothetical protein
MDTRSRERASLEQSGLSGVKSASGIQPILHVVEANARAESTTVTATVRIRESVWKRTKIQAIEEGTTIAAIVERALEGILEPRPDRKNKASGQS